MSLGQFIARRRKYLRLSQEELAQKLQVSKSAVGKWEIDRGIPDRGNLVKLAEVLQITIGDLYHLIDAQSHPTETLNINITTEIIALLESYGYKVIAPNELEERNKEE